MLAVAGEPQSGANPTIIWRVVPPESLKTVAQDLRTIAANKPTKVAASDALNRLHRCVIVYRIESPKRPKTRQEEARLDELVKFAFFVEGEKPAGKVFLARVSSPASLKEAVRKGLFIKDVVEHYRTLTPRTLLG